MVIILHHSLSSSGRVRSGVINSTKYVESTWRKPPFMASGTCLRPARNHSRGSYGQSPFARVGCWDSIAAMWYAFLSGRYSKKLRMLRSNQVMTRYMKSPVVVSSDSTPQPISAIPFPAVTICNMNKASGRRVLGNIALKCHFWLSRQVQKSRVKHLDEKLRLHPEDQGWYSVSHRVNISFGHIST